MALRSTGKRKSNKKIGGGASLEALEYRRLLSGAPDTITLTNGLVTITGTAQSDQFSMAVDPNNSNNFEFAIITPGVNTVTASFPKASITNGVTVFCDPQNTTPVGPNADIINFGGFNVGGTLGVNLGTGSDTVFGQLGPNLINGSGSNGPDVLYGGPGNDTIRGGVGNNKIFGAQGDDVLFGGGGNNVINGGSGNDQIIGGGGHDTLRAGPGIDTITGGNADSLLVGGSGNDFITGGNGNDTIIGGGGNSTLQGGPGNDFIAAHWENFLATNGGTPLTSANDSRVFAGGGNDTVAAITGNSDVLTGGGGNNSFAIGNNATITDPGNAAYISKVDTFSSASPAVAINISLAINLNLGGVISQVVIPLNAGSSPLGNSTAMATSANGHIHFRSDVTRTFTLADFFNHWGVNFGLTGIGQFETLGNGHTIAMTVNGVNNVQFANYAVQNGDNIVITYTQ
ncbi:MAG: hypothetical protein M3O30_06325 [Planctomycetota bacterium]|nr:hypothetical protein [Planctomycetota bacterium]